MKIVKVKWIDSCSLSPYWNPGGDVKADKITSVGFVNKKTKREIVLLSADAKGGSQGGFFIIPRSAITSIKRLR